MKVSKNIEVIIDRLSTGYIFTYSDFDISVSKREAVIKTLNRLAASGKIKKMSKGRYYKPENSVFGQLQPSVYQIVKDLLENDGKVIGYLTGYSVYNELGLTTQVPNVIQIGRNSFRPAIKRDIYTIKFVVQKNKITKENIFALKILDAIKFIREIPDTTVENSCVRLMSIIKDMERSEVERLKTLSLKYPPSTRALLGAMIEQTIGSSVAESIRNTINPITKYKFEVSQQILPTLKNWNIR